MFSAEDATRRSTLKGLGCIQMFLGLSALCGSIASMSMGGSVDKTYTGIWSSLFYILLGMLSVQGSRFVEGPPPRGVLLAGMIINILVGVMSCIAAIISIMALTIINASSFEVVVNNPSSGRCADILVSVAKATVAEGLIRLILVIPVCMTAAVLASKLRKAVVVTTTHQVAYSAPAQPYIANVNPAYGSSTTGYPSGSTPYPGYISQNEIR